MHPIRAGGGRQVGLDAVGMAEHQHPVSGLDQVRITEFEFADEARGKLGQGLGGTRTRPQSSCPSRNWPRVSPLRVVPSCR